MSERDMLKEEAKSLGLEFENNIPTTKLQELVDWAKDPETEGSSVEEPENKYSIQEELAEVKPQVEVVEDYYENHPRRIIKLKGLLSRTFDNDEYVKISRMISDLERA
jgi:hypothetical protein